MQGMPGRTDGDVTASSRDNERRASGRRRLTRVVYLTAAAVLVADQATKLAAVTWLRPLHSVPVLGRYLSFTYATNTGGAFGVMPTATAALTVVAMAVVVALILATRRLEGNRLVAAGVACLLGGALGNLVDRLRVGYVIDFIDVHFWPVFNLADIGIVVGAGLLLVATVVGTLRHPAREESD